MLGSSSGDVALNKIAAPGGMSVRGLAVNHRSHVVRWAARHSLAPVASWVLMPTKSKPARACTHKGFNPSLEEMLPNCEVVTFAEVHEQCATHNRCPTKEALIRYPPNSIAKPLESCWQISYTATIFTWDLMILARTTSLSSKSLHFLSLNTAINHAYQAGSPAHTTSANQPISAGVHVRDSWFVEDLRGCHHRWCHHPSITHFILHTLHRF